MMFLYRVLQCKTLSLSLIIIFTISSSGRTTDTVNIAKYKLYNNTIFRSTTVYLCMRTFLQHTVLNTVSVNAWYFAVTRKNTINFRKVASYTEHDINVCIPAAEIIFKLGDRITVRHVYSPNLHGRYKIHMCNFVEF